MRRNEVPMTHSMIPKHFMFQTAFWANRLRFASFPVFVLSGCVMVKTFDSSLIGHRFNYRPFHFLVTTLGKLFTHLCLCHCRSGIRMTMRGLSTCGLEAQGREMGIPLLSSCMTEKSFAENIHAVAQTGLVCNSGQAVCGTH